MSQGSDIIVQIKGNQEMLLNKVKELTTSLEPLSTCSQKEAKKHGRIEYREASVFEVPKKPFSLPYEWHGLFKAVIRVRRYTDKFDTKIKQWRLVTEVAYYGSSCLLNAELAAECIRFHWCIENRNHYVRDVSLGEDASRIRKNPGIFARLRSFALNLLRYNQVSNVKKALFENALNFENILNYQGIF